MQIIINIDDNIYNHTQEYEEGGFSLENDKKLYQAIKNGILLPKEYGRLIDADELIKKYQNEDNDNYYDISDAEIICIALRDAPTIIKANKKGENGKYVDSSK